MLFLTPPLSIIDLPAAASHYTRGRHGAAPRFIILHHTGGTDSRAWLTRTSPNRVSCHRLIMTDGTNYKIVSDSDTSHCAGFGTMGPYHKDVSPNLNHVTLNIELENIGDGQQPYPAAQMDMCARQVIEWWGRYGFLPVLGHCDVDPAKNDPRGFDWTFFWRLCNSYVLRYQVAASAPQRLTYTPIVHAPTADTATLAAYAQSRGADPARAHVLAELYTLLAPAYGVDPAAVFAQACHETAVFTSWWSSPPRRNLCGLGVTGERRSAKQDGDPAWQAAAELGWEVAGYAFVDDAVAVRAHLTHLAGYVYAVLPPAVATTDDPRWAALAEAGYRGVASVWADLNTRWAVGSEYAQGIERHYQAIQAMRQSHGKSLETD